MSNERDFSRGEQKRFATARKGKNGRNVDKAELKEELRRYSQERKKAA